MFIKVNQKWEGGWNLVKNQGNLSIQEKFNPVRYYQKKPWVNMTTWGYVENKINEDC